MRKLLAIVAALAGGYLLWSGFRFARLLLILDDSRFDATMLTIAGVMGAVGAGLMFLGWRLFRDPARPPPSDHPGAPPTP